MLCYTCLFQAVLEEVFKKLSVFLAGLSDFIVALNLKLVIVYCEICYFFNAGLFTKYIQMKCKNMEAILLYHVLVSGKQNAFVLISIVN